MTSDWLGKSHKEMHSSIDSALTQRFHLEYNISYQLDQTFPSVHQNGIYAKFDEFFTSDRCYCRSSTKR